MKCSTKDKIKAIQDCRCNLSQAAKVLNMSRQALSRWYTRRYHERTIIKTKKDLRLETLKKHNGNIKNAALELGLSGWALYKYLERNK